MSRRLPPLAFFALFALFAFGAFASLSRVAAAADLPPVPGVAARSWLLMDPASGQLLASHQPDERIEPASLTKLMTAYVVFSAIRDRQLSLSQIAHVSDRAWRAVGSRMFIEPNRPVTVEELIHGMIVQSGNDACVALAEAVAGSEVIFAQLMTREAQRLGMKNTRFANSSGLPDANHYSTARDLGLLAAALIRDFPDQYRYYSLREYRYNNITQQNRNRLLWLDPNVDGIKTGHTEAAGFCLVASARRGGRRLLSVLIGAASDGARAQESQRLLNYGFQLWDGVRLYQKGQTISELEVWKGSDRHVKAGATEDLQISVPRGQADRIKTELVSLQPLMAPLATGQRVATLKVSVDGRPLAEFPVVALEAVSIAGPIGRLWDSMRLWLR